MTISAKANVNDEVFFIRQIKKTNCPVCGGDGKISLGEPIKFDCSTPEDFVNSFGDQMTRSMMDVALGNTKEYTCPECHGKGIVKMKGQPKYEIIQGRVSMISITINSKDNFVTYTVIAEDKKVVVQEDNIFLTQEEADKRCAFLNLERKLIPIGDIKIPTDFAATIPSDTKISARLSEWRKKKRFDNEIYIDFSHELFDGYTSYLVYKMLGINEVPVVIWPEKA